jgi:hypothetical protein
VTLPTLTTLKNWAHDATAVAAGLGFFFGLGATALAQVDPADSVKYGPEIAAISGAVVLLSKGIDSVYGWMTTGKLPAVVAAAPAPAPPSP